MAAGLEPVHYRAADGTAPVDAFIEALAPEQQAAVDNQLARLELLDARRPHLPLPHGFSIDEELQALRCSAAGRAYHVIYRRSFNLGILLHISPSRADRAAADEVGAAREAWEDVRRRMRASRPSPGGALESRETPARIGRSPSPIGEALERTRARRRQSRAYAREAVRLARPEAAARLLIAARLERGLSQREIAEVLSLAPAAASRLERGRAPISRATLEAIAAALGTRLPDEPGPAGAGAAGAASAAPGPRR